MLCRGPGLCSSLSSWRAMGAHDDQYPHIFYPLYEKLLYKLAQVYSKGGVGRQSPKETCANAGMWGKPAKATMTRGGFLINKQNELAGDRDKRKSFFLCIFHND